MMYSLDEIGILPSDSPVDIVSRRECDVYTENGTLPIFVAPMTSVVDKDNYELFSDNDVIPIIPRRIDNLKFRLNACNHIWCAFSLTEFEDYFCKNSADECPLILIDIANGHMKKVYDLVKTAKSIWSDIKIMIGNIAHPKMYWYAYEAGVDYVRVGIGTGSACVTEGTKILMADNSYKCIEDIEIGEYVKTLHGSKEVINTFNKIVKETITINNQIECTPDHKFFVINKSDKSKITKDNILDYGFYIEAKNLTSDYLLVEAKNV